MSCGLSLKLKFHMSKIEDRVCVCARTHIYTQNGYLYYEKISNNHSIQKVGLKSNYLYFFLIIFYAWWDSPCAYDNILGIYIWTPDTYWKKSSTIILDYYIIRFTRILNLYHDCITQNYPESNIKVALCIMGVLTHFSRENCLYFFYL